MRNASFLLNLLNISTEKEGSNGEFLKSYFNPDFIRTPCGTRSPSCSFSPN